MAEDDRHRVAQGAFDYLEVGVTKAGRFDPDQHVARREIGGFHGFNRKHRLRRVKDRGLIGKWHWKISR